MNKNLPCFILKLGNSPELQNTFFSVALGEQVGLQERYFYILVSRTLYGTLSKKIINMNETFEIKKEYSDRILYLDHYDIQLRYIDRSLFH